MITDLLTYRLALFWLTVSLSGAPAFSADAKHGAQLFASNCAFCHPAGGNALNPAKPLKGEVFRKAFPKDSTIVALVRKGIPKTVMTPFPRGRLSDDQVNDIIAYLRTLTPEPSACPPTQPMKSGYKSPAPANSAVKNGQAGRSHAP